MDINLEAFVTKTDPHFPILIYEEEGNWVGESVLTGTIAVCDSPVAARDEVLRLLTHEIEDALKSAPNAEAALNSLWCDDIRPELEAMFMRSQRQPREQSAIRIPKSLFRGPGDQRRRFEVNVAQVATPA